jgi:hypothetical protein
MESHGRESHEYSHTEAQVRSYLGFPLLRRHFQEKLWWDDDEFVA